MIHIRRDRKDAARRPIAPPKAWFKAAETATEEVIAAYPNHVFDGALYGDDRVRAALEELFHEKCAYCEHPLPETGWNVEHFRPKGRVAENQHRPGYYWLAYDWDNLYPSCVPCNQRRKDKPRWGDMKYGIAGGKDDQFPLEDEATRVSSPGVTVEEIREGETTLLIDPCYDDPEDYLTFDVTGQVEAIDENPYGEATIRVFNLWRRRLRDKRTDVIRSVCELLKLERGLRNEKTRAKADEVRKYIAEFMAADHCHFAAVARAVLADPDRFLGEDDDA